MNKILCVIVFSIFLTSCSEHNSIENVENIKMEAFKSKEFKDLQLAYNNYLDFGKTYNTAFAMKMYKDKPFLRDTIIFYSNKRDSLGKVIKKKI